MSTTARKEDLSYCAIQKGCFFQRSRTNTSCRELQYSKAGKYTVSLTVKNANGILLTFLYTAYRQFSIELVSKLPSIFPCQFFGVDKSRSLELNRMDTFDQTHGWNFETNSFLNFQWRNSYNSLIFLISLILYYYSIYCFWYYENNK